MDLVDASAIAARVEGTGSFSVVREASVHVVAAARTRPRHIGVMRRR
jgi:hypothetical protein